MEVEPGTYQSFKIEIKEDLVCRQEELDGIVEERVGKIFEMAGVDE
jgi:ketol-acid reductoisomerase